MSFLTRAEKGTDLTPAEADAIITTLYRAELPATIVSGVITLQGSGFYIVTPESGITDDLTGITLSGENVNGTTIHLSTATVGHTIVVRHGGNIHLMNGQHAALGTIYSGIWLRHRGSGIWFELMPRMSVP
jgi:hypothetical protein